MTEPTYYTTAEKARLTYVVGKATVRAIRGKDPAKYDAEIDRIKKAAIEREQAEQDARDQAAKDKRAQAAKNSANHWF